MIEVSCWFCSEEPSCPSWVSGPTIDILGVRPQEISISTIVRNFLHALDESDLINQLHFRTQPAMNAENAIIDNRCNSKVVEDFSAKLPGISVSIFAEALTSRNL